MDFNFRDLEGQPHGYKDNMKEFKCLKDKTQNLEKGLHEKEYLSKRDDIEN
jgi:hypothetical protein